MATRTLHPDQNLGTLISEVSHMLRRSFNRRVRSFGLTQPQWRAIVCLRRAQGMNQAKLAEVLEIQPISLARLIDRMAASGWVERRPDPNDRRAVQLFLTPKAEPILTELGVAAAAMHEVATAGLSPAQCEQMAAMLGVIKLNLQHDESPSQQTA